MTQGYHFLGVEWTQKERDTLTNYINTLNFEPWSTGTIQTHIVPESDWEKIPEVVENVPSGFYEIEIWRNPPRSDIGVHMDRGRTSAVNFPVLNDGMLYVAKPEHSDWFEENKIVKYVKGYQGAYTPINKWPPITEETEYLYNKELVDRPVLLDTKTPHCAFNLSSDYRYIITVAYDKPYSEMLKVLNVS